MCWTSAVVISIVVLPPFLSSSAAIPSGPGAFLFGKECSTFTISSLVGVSPSVTWWESAGRSCCWYSPCQNDRNSLMSLPVSSTCYLPRLLLWFFSFFTNSHCVSLSAIIWFKFLSSRFILLNSFLAFSYLTLDMFRCYLSLSAASWSPSVRWFLYLLWAIISYRLYLLTEYGRFCLFRVGRRICAAAFWSTH